MIKVFKFSLIATGVLLLSACSKQPIPDIIKDGNLKAPSNGNSMLYVYRLSSLMGMGVYYDIHDSAQEDKVLGTLENDTIIAQEIPPGPRKIWARTEVKDEVNIDAKPNEINCIKGSVGFGLIVGHPHLSVIDRATCEQEIREIIAGRK